MASNIERLREAGCLAEGADLTDAEEKVIRDLSDKEVETLISIRKRLGEAHGEGAGGGLELASLDDEDSADPMANLTPNIIV